MRARADFDDREMEIIKRLSWGYARKDVADELCLSEDNLKFLLKKIFKKLEITKVTELAVWYFCQKCGVSWDLDPLKRTLTIILACIILTHDLYAGSSYQRARRSGRRTEVRARRNENNSNNDLIYI